MQETPCSPPIPSSTPHCATKLDTADPPPSPPATGHSLLQATRHSQYIPALKVQGHTPKRAAKVNILRGALGSPSRTKLPRELSFIVGSMDKHCDVAQREWHNSRGDIVSDQGECTNTVTATCT